MILISSHCENKTYTTKILLQCTYSEAYDTYDQPLRRINFDQIMGIKNYFVPELNSDRFVLFHNCNFDNNPKGSMQLNCPNAKC